MKLNQVVAASLAALASQVAFAQSRVGATDDGGFLALIAGGLALGIWIVRRNKSK